MLAVLVGWVCLVWYLVILFVCGVGYVQMYGIPAESNILETDILADIDTTAHVHAQAYLKHSPIARSPMLP